MRRHGLDELALPAANASNTCVGRNLRGNKDAVTFQLTLRDGRKVLGSAKPTAFQEIQTAEFTCRGQEPPPRVEARPPEPLTGRGIAVRVGLVALFLGGVYVGASKFLGDLIP